MTQQINNSVLESNTSGHSSGLRLCSGTHHDCYIDLVISLHKALTLQLKMTNCNISSDLDVHVRMNSYVIKSDIKSITSNICDTVLSNDQIHTDTGEHIDHVLKTCNSYLYLLKRIKIYLSLQNRILFHNSYILLLYYLGQM